MAMKFYKDGSNTVYAFDADGSQDAWIRPGLTPITQEQADLLRNPPPSQEQMVEEAHARINADYADAYASLIGGYPPDEVASWPKQEAEARAYLADADADTPWLKGASLSSGINVPNLAALIIRNADAFSPQYGALTGKLKTLRDQIDALEDPTQEQLDAIQW